jgi:CBS domain-containing protein
MKDEPLDDMNVGFGLHIERPSCKTASDVMTPLALALTERASIARAAALMAFEGVHHVVLVGATGAVVGVLSSLDIARWLGAQSGYVFATRARPRDGL